MIGTVQKQPVIRIPHVQSRQTAAAQQVIGFMNKVQKIRLNGTKQIGCVVLCKQRRKETIEVQQDQVFLKIVSETDSPRLILERFIPKGKSERINSGKTASLEKELFFW